MRARTYLIILTFIVAGMIPPITILLTRPSTIFIPQNANVHSVNSLRYNPKTGQIVAPRSKSLISTEHERSPTNWTTTAFPERVKDISMSPTKYPRRINMGACPPLFGKVTVLVAVVKHSYETHYRVAQQTLQCYLRSVNYTFLLVDLDSDQRVNQRCPHDQLFFKKHCAASVYLEDTDWMLVLDADTGTVNPNHCIEEWIDTRVDLIFYERFFNWEIASGNYLAKNTPFARNFLRKWADWQYMQPSNWNGADNGVLQMHILQTLLPDAKQSIKNCDTIWHRGTDYKTYMAFVTCVKLSLGEQRLWPGKLRILRRAHGWVRDGFITYDKWSDRDFMLHGWKQQNISENGWKSPFEKIENADNCGQNVDGWHWRSTSHVDEVTLKKILHENEKFYAKDFPTIAQIIPYLSEPDIGDCYPNCDEYT